MTACSIEKGDWDFLHGSWNDGPDGQLIPPDGTDVEYLAVRHDKSYSDFSATFRFKFRGFGGGARLMFRIQGSGRYYALDFPINGQQSRSRHFWAGMVVADGTPLQRYLQFGLVPGLCASAEQWYDVQVEAQGPHLRAWVNDIPVVDVVDDSYAAGPIGLGSIASPFRENAHFADLQITGTSTPTQDWPGLSTCDPYWITPCQQTDPTTYQSYARMFNCGNGKALLNLTFGNPNSGETRYSCYIRSDDAGRTWKAPEPCTLQQGLGAPFVRRDGTWVFIYTDEPNVTSPVPNAKVYCYTSNNEGHSWNVPEPLQIDGDFGPWKVEYAFPPIRMRDGALVLPIMIKLEGEQPPTCIPFLAAMVLRSEDDGHTWSKPVLCDCNPSTGTPLTPDEVGLAARYFELGMDEVDDDVLIGIGRPERDPYMWQIQSNDGGRTWLPGALGHFPGYCPTMTRTESGVLVATTRYPYFAAHISRNHGRTWEPPIIVDYAQWAGQWAFEVEPNIVLVSYMGHIQEPGKADCRIVRLKVTESGLELDH